ncbi:BTAD domain-containing putative transcriptional regulator [Pyxidicoccus xibeiensis]|uniref:BTAD domain-containing putative transcriptional regulator n=1 Tax=Pyxidicoccus xibeiensis TaxID=2906759 RepID=UPI0020A6E5C8|nr:BTAD domain-containing putative transcriptional regulator [Pyxidicoccus xibeiensis]MCP3136608.1 AAA family ATPase [Pyxidicoccus xibeiensis]
MAGDGETGTRSSRVQLFGEARLRKADTLVPLERRTAGVVAWLALEGPHPKYRLAGLLWPESSEATARNNMRQLLRRLRLATGEELVQGTDVLSLADSVVTDAAELQAHVQAGRHARALELDGVLLGTLEFDDCPELQTWLDNARERMDKLRRRAAFAESEACERRGDLPAALALAERLLKLDPFSEDAWRRLMRLQYVTGDRMAALNTFERCRRLLREELDTTPLPETLALAREIERGPAASKPLHVSRPRLPLSVLRPPVLVGREKEWARMEAAWEAGQIIFLCGAPGVGKTRLAHDFAASRGTYHTQEGRPGEQHIPYATHVRFSRQMLAKQPDLVLEPWVRREMARLMPELAGPEGAPPPMEHEGDRARFLDASCEFLRQLCAGVDTLVTDDVQFMDPDSAGFGELLMSREHAPGPQPRRFARFVDTVRLDELQPEILERVRGLQAAGLAVVIELEPLGAASVGALLGSLELPGAEPLAADVLRYTGGNPLFIMETLRNLLETGGLARGWPEQVLPTGRVRQLILQRLQRLSPPALQMARVAALARMDFGLELAGEVLELNPLSLATPAAELEAAHILRGERFTHDLLFEAVRESIPGSLALLLHRRLAAALEQRRASPAAIAQHWLDGGEPLRAAPFLVAAANAQTAELRHDEAALLYLRAAALLEAAGDAEQAARVRALVRVKHGG